MTKKTLLALVCATLWLAAAPAVAAAELKVTDIVVGTGDVAKANSRVSVHYTGWLLDGTKFDSSRDRNQPFSFILGGGQVIPGWDQGVEGMKVGGKRELVIPPDLAYGRNGAGDAIPPDATLKFEVELLAVAPPPFQNVSSAELADLIARGVPVVDIRTPGEWQETGIIPGAKTIMAFDERGRFNNNFLAEFARVAGKDDDVVLICRSGNRSAAVANFLATRAGYTNVYNVTNGMNEWRKERRQTVKP